MEKLIQKVIETLINSTLSNYNISKGTGISVSSIRNYRNKKTIPTDRITLILAEYFKIPKSDFIPENKYNIVNKNTWGNNVNNFNIVMKKYKFKKCSDVYIFHCVLCFSRQNKHTFFV